MNLSSLSTTAAVWPTSAKAGGQAAAFASQFVTGPRAPGTEREHSLGVLADAHEMRAPSAECLVPRPRNRVCRVSWHEAPPVPPRAFAPQRHKVPTAASRPGVELAATCCDHEEGQRGEGCRRCLRGACFPPPPQIWLLLLRTVCKLLVKSPCHSRLALQIYRNKRMHEHPMLLQGSCGDEKLMRATVDFANMSD